MEAKRTHRNPKAANSPNLADVLLVTSKVKTRFSKFKDTKSLMGLITSNTFRNDDQDAYLDIVPCAPNEPCCFGKPDTDGKNHTYFFENIFSDLKYRLPLSDITCSVLTLLNVAPTQLHCNSWAYVKAFEFLYQTLGIEPTSNRFFYFFETSGRSVKGEYLSSAAARGQGIFTLFRSNYKHFKGKFFRLNETEKCKDVFYFEDGSPKFPFYWTNRYEAIIKLPVESLTPEELVDCTFLSTIDLNLTEFLNAHFENKLGEYVGKMFEPLFTMILFVDYSNSFVDFYCRQNDSPL